MNKFYPEMRAECIRTLLGNGTFRLEFFAVDFVEQTAPLFSTYAMPTALMMSVTGCTFQFLIESEILEELPY